MAHLDSLGGDRWRVRVNLGTHPTTGKRWVKSRSFTAAGIRAAERKARKLTIEIEADAARLGEHDGTVSGLIDEWRASVRRHLAPTTLKGYDRWAERIRTALGHLPSDGVQKRHVDGWFAALHDDGHSPANIEQGRRVLRLILRWGWRERGLPAPPSTATGNKVRSYKADVDVPAVRRLIAALPRESYRQSTRAILLLAHTGMRRGEVVGIELTDIDDDKLLVRHSVSDKPGGGVHIGPPKGKVVLPVVLDDVARQVIDEQVEWMAAEGIVSRWLFPDLRADPSGDTPRRPGWLSTVWTRHRGGSRVRLHDLRHHYAVSALAAGASHVDVQAQLRHAKASTTLDIYGSPTSESRRRMADAVGKAISDN